MGSTDPGIAPARERAHLVGMDGRGMPGLAQIFHQRGFAVSGSVAAAEAPGLGHLRRLGIRVHSGHAPPALPASARLVVFGTGVPSEHPERLSARRSGVEQASCPEVIGGLLNKGFGIASVGGRKAGVVAAMVGWTLSHAGLDPTVLLGSHAPQLGGSGRQGAGSHVVVDLGDDPARAEASGAAVVMVLDDPARIGHHSTLGRWAEAAPSDGYVLGCGGEDVPPEADGRPGSGAEVERVSLSPGHAWWGADLKADRGRYSFRAFHRGQFVTTIRLVVPGRHQVLAALATLAACGRAGVTPRSIREALEDFEGVSRGFESRGSYRGVTLVDDEARGHLAVAEALAAAREVHGRRRLCVAYRADPAGADVGPSAEDFRRADRVLILDEEGPAGGSGAARLEAGLRASGVPLGRASGVVEAVDELDRHLEPGDVLVTLGAGGVGTIADAFLRRLSRDRHG